MSSIAQTSGKCTNPAAAGAFSGAALSSQAIGDLAGSSTELGTSAAVEAIGERRERQIEACPAGQTLVDGLCKPSVAPAIVAVPVSPAPRTAVVKSHLASKPQKTLARQAAPAPRRRVAAAPVPPMTPPPMAPVVDQTFRIGSWAQGFGDYEHRTGSKNTTFNCCEKNQPDGPYTNVTLDVTSTMSSGGFVGGIDATKHGLTGPDDGLIFGVLGGYTWVDITVKTAVISRSAVTASGSSLTTADINGPSVGFYATYFNGPFANDFLLKNDFLSFNESNSQTLGFGGCECFTAFKSPIPFTSDASGSGSTSLDQLTLSDDLSYKIPLNHSLWLRPTVGLKYIDSMYSSSAAALGLADGDVLRLQGGATLGMDSFAGLTHVTTTATGLLFDDVIVTGNNIEGGANFSNSGNILNDQGRLQAKGILAVNFDLGHGFSASVLGDVYGGEGIFGAGGKASLRMEW